MKIIYLTPLPPPAGGIASWTKRVLSSNSISQHEVHVVNTAVTGKRATQFAKRNVFDEIIRSKNIKKDLKQKLKSVKPDIVHVNTSCGKYGLIRDCFLAKMAKKYQAKVLLHCHCDVSIQANSLIGRYFYKKTANIADVVLTLNTPSKEFTKSVANKDSVILPNFILKESIPGLNEEKSINETVEKVIYVGHVTKAKGSDVIIKVAERFPNITFSLFGYISEEIASLAKPDNVLLYGEVSSQEVMNAFNESDVFLFPTLTEGFPMALLEAMAYGMPCITTSVGAIPDMLEHRGGIILKPGSVEDFVIAVGKLFHDRELRFQMSQWNKEKVHKCYTQDIVLNKMLSIYKNIVKFV